jgi:hypothetical protein
VLGKAEQSQDVSFFIELTIESEFFRILKYQYVGNSSSLIVGRMAMRPHFCLWALNKKSPSLKL